MPASQRVELEAQLAPYRRRHRGVRWTSPDTWHLTLLFLASVPAPRASELVVLAAAVARAGEGPYRVRVERGGGRHRRGEGVAWLALSEGADRLMGLAGLAADACPADISGRAPPKRTPSAHLTLVRRADAAVVHDLREQARGPLGVSWLADRLVLVRSHLEPGGARYETLHESPL